MTILVKPHTPRPAKINPRAASVAVAVLSTNSFDARALDIHTVRLGPSGTEATPRHSRIADVNRDGHPDLVLTFNMRDAHITCTTSGLTLTGTTTTGPTGQRNRADSNNRLPREEALKRTGQGAPR